MSYLVLSYKCLKSMRKAYRANGQDIFEMPFFVEAFPGNSTDDLSNALYLLKSTGVVDVQSADNMAYLTAYRPLVDQKNRLQWLLSALWQALGLFKP